MAQTLLRPARIANKKLLAHLKTILPQCRFEVPQGTLEISQLRSGWFRFVEKFRAEGTMETGVKFSTVPPGRILFWTLNPARCAGLISGVAPRPKRRRLPALVAQALQKIFDEGLHLK